jgi:hypothetical protein
MVSSATSSLPFNTRDTVETDTPASLATSCIVTARFFWPIGRKSVGIRSGNDTGIDTGIVIVIIAKIHYNVNKQFPVTRNKQPVDFSWRVPKWARKLIITVRLLAA